MDQDTVDKLARLVGSGQSRRRILKTLTGGALGAITAAIGLDQASAAVRCRTQGVACSKNADCCSANCLPKDRTGHRVCAECGSTADCPASDQCRTAICSGGACGFSVHAGACDDGNACTINDVCQPNGTCAGTAVVCPKPDQCRAQGTCNSSTGVCSNPAATDGTACDGGVCLSGTCCTPDNGAACNGKCGSQTNNCGQTIECGSCFCADQDNGTPCGEVRSGLRCCNGICPSPTCLPHLTCCDTAEECAAQCCSQQAFTEDDVLCVGRAGCAVSVFDAPCGDDYDCGSGNCTCGICSGNGA